MTNHVLITGTTNSGKTTLAKYLFLSEPHKAIFFNTQLENIRGDTTLNYNTASNLLNTLKKENLVVYQPSGYKTVAAKELNYITDQIFKVGRVLKKGQRANHWVTIYIDEAHNFTYKQSPTDPLQKTAMQGIGHGIRLITISQRPAKISHDILGNTETHYIYKTANWDQPYLDTYKIPIESFKTWVDKPHHFIKYEGGFITYYRPVPPEYST